MTMPRDARPGVTWLVTRRTTRRYHLFSPDKKGLVEAIYWYVTAIYAARLGIQVHMAQLLSTHIHEVLTDTLGNLSKFFELRNRALVNALKTVLPWPEEILSKTPANWVECPDAATVLHAMGYTAANCVAAGLVCTPSEWPGAKTLPEDVGMRVIRVKRPEMYFRASNPMWLEEAELRIEMPAVLEAAFGSHDACHAAIAAKTAELVQQAQDKNATTESGYAGVEAVLESPHTRRAKTPEPVGQRNPTFAARGNADLAARLVARRRAFHEAYRKAWTEWKQGNRDVVFPLGTYKMRVVYNVPCSPPPLGSASADCTMAHAPMCLSGNANACTGRALPPPDAATPAPTSSRLPPPPREYAGAG